MGSFGTEIEDVNIIGGQGRGQRLGMILFGMRPCVGLGLGTDIGDVNIAGGGMGRGTEIRMFIFLEGRGGSVWGFTLQNTPHPRYPALQSPEFLSRVGSHL